MKRIAFILLGNWLVTACKDVKTGSRQPVAATAITDTSSLKLYTNNHQDADSLALLQLTRKFNRWVEEEGRLGDYVKPSGKKPDSFLLHLLLMLNIIYCYENISFQTT